MAKLADAIRFECIEELCEKILDKLDEDNETFLSIIGKYENIRVFIKKLMTYDKIGFESLILNAPEYNDCCDEYVVDIWNDNGEILFGCEPAKRDGRYLNCEGNVLYLFDDIKQSVLNTCKYDEMYFVIIGDDECSCENDCDEDYLCDCHKDGKELSTASSYTINGKAVSKEQFDKKYAEIQDRYEKNIKRMFINYYADFMDDINNIFARLW